MPRQSIEEGSANIIVDISDIPSRKEDVFFNPKMELNRTLSIELLRVSGKDNLAVCLPLAGSGVRAVRFEKELDNIKSIDVNDNNPKAVKLIKQNIKNNECKLISVHELDANKFLEDSKGYDYIDIDPFGSPNFLLDVACRKISRKGILAITATDTGALAGTFPSAGKFKYWAKTYLCPQKHEIGLRILIRKAMLMATPHEKALTPILSYHDQHYYRVFFSVEKGRTKAANSFNKLNDFFHHCSGCTNHFTSKNEKELCPECKKETTSIGPIYNGPLQDKRLIKKMLKNTKHEKFLTTLYEEDDGVGYFDTHVFCEKNKLPLKKIDDLITELKKKGFIATRSSTNDTAIKTNADFKTFKKLFK